MVGHEESGRQVEGWRAQRKLVGQRGCDGVGGGGQGKGKRKSVENGSTEEEGGGIIGGTTFYSQAFIRGTVSSGRA